MKQSLFALCFFSAIISKAQLPPFQWANKLVGARSISLATDALGNVYTFGNIGMGATLDVDPGPGTYFLSGDDGTKIIYKFNTLGGFIWAKQLSGNASTECIRVDAAENVYVVGQFGLTADFDPGPGVFNLTAVSQNDIFTLKLDAAGNFLWAKSQGGSQGEIGYSVAISDAGTVYTTGYFSGTADFDPSAGVFNMTAGILSDCFISALDANGNFLWAKQIAGGFNQAHHMATNSLGSLLIAGQFSGTKDFDPGGGVFNMTSNGASDIFILKLDGLGNFIWAKNVGGIGSDGDEAVALDPLGNVYATGSFKFTSDFDPGPGTFDLTASGSTDMFVLKLNINGNFVWAKQMTGLLSEVGKDIATDATGNVYTTGIFQDIADFDPGPAVFNLTTNGSNDIFISKLDTDGNFGWAVGFGEVTSEDEGQGISVDAAGSVYTTGAFLGQIDFDPGPGVSILLNGNTAIFLHKFGPGGVLPLTLLDFSATPTANGTLLKWQTTIEINTKHFEVEWGTDGVNYSKINTIPASGNSTQTLHYNFTHAQPKGGINYYRLKMIDKDNRYSYSPVVTVKIKNNTPAISVFPNPVAGILQMNVQADKNETILFKLSNAAGKIIESKSFVLVKGNNRLSWDLHQLAAGNYYISPAHKQFETIKITRQ